MRFRIWCAERGSAAYMLDPEFTAQSIREDFAQHREQIVQCTLQLLSGGHVQNSDGGVFWLDGVQPPGDRNV